MTFTDKEKELLGLWLGNRIAKAFIANNGHDVTTYLETEGKRFEATVHIEIKDVK